jgi:hypothetical protein
VIGNEEKGFPLRSYLELQGVLVLELPTHTIPEFIVHDQEDGTATSQPLLALRLILLDNSLLVNRLNFLLERK